MSPRHLADRAARLGIANDLLGPFLDAGSVPKISQVGPSTMRVEGTRRFQTLDADFVEIDQFPWLARKRIKRGKVILEPLGDYLAQLADLKSVARSMLAFLRGRISDPDAVVQGRLVPAPDAEQQPVSQVTQDVDAFTAIQSELSALPTRGTKLTFLHGHAGSGKSWMLMSCALQQAQRFLSREEHRLFLYVDAQGANLRSLEQQISKQLDLYNGVLRFQEVVPLVRVGALGLIIDGFDELIMPSGYNDTLNALAAYIESLAGDGNVLASARTAFFHSYDLAHAGVRVAIPIEQRVFEVAPWGATERTEYCRLRGAGDVIDELEAVVRRSGGDRELLGRPFVVSEIVNLILKSGSPQESEVMILIEQAFLERERTEKLVEPDAPTRRPLLTQRQFHDLLTEIALEMWHLGSTSLDVASLRVLVGLFLEGEQLRPDLKRIVTQRIDVAPILTLVPSPTREARVQFPHEILFARFLARGLLAQLNSGEPGVRSVLRGAPLADSCLEQVALLASHSGSLPFAISGHTLERTLAFVSRLGDCGRTRSDDDRNLRLNAGQLALSLLRAIQHPTAVTLKCCQFDRARFSGLDLSDVVFKDCVFEEVDARLTDWHSAEFQECDAINKLLASDGQKFPLSLPPVMWLAIEEQGQIFKEFFGESVTRGVLFGEQVLGIVQRAPLSNRAKAISDVTERLARRAMRVFWFTEHPDDSDDRGLRNLKRGEAWLQAVKLLEEHGLLRRESRARQGVTSQMVHIEGAAEILRGSQGDYHGLSDRVREFWEVVTRI